MHVQPPYQERNLVKWAGSAGMFVLLSRGVNCWFWYLVRCSRGNANFIFHTGIVKGCPWRNRGRNQLERIKTFLPYALEKNQEQAHNKSFYSKFPKRRFECRWNVCISLWTIQPCIGLYINLWSQKINFYKMLLHKILSALLSSVLARWIKQSL